MTSNIGSHIIQENLAGLTEQKSRTKKIEKTKKDLTRVFAKFLIFRLLPEDSLVSLNKRPKRPKVESCLAG